MFVWLIIAAALPPIPPDTERGAIVFDALPIKTPVLASDERMRLPDPFGVTVRLEFPPEVEMVVPVIDILFVPKSRVPTFVMF